VYIYILEEDRYVITHVYLCSYYNKLEVTFHNNLLFTVRTWALRRIFGPEKEEVAGGWKRLHNEELHKLNASSNVISVFKSGRMGWAGLVARKILV
jgi:hypothetical protein